MTKNIIAVAVIAASIISCNTNKESAYHISGDAPNVYNGMRVYLQQLDISNQPVMVDTAIIMEEKFFFDNPVKVNFPELRILTLDGADGNYVFVADEEKVHITLHKDSLWSSLIKGSEQNIALADFKRAQVKQRNMAQKYSQERNELTQKGAGDAAAAITNKWVASEEEMRAKGLEIIKKYPNNIVSTLVLGELITNKYIDNEDATEYYETLGQQLKENPLTKQMGDYLNSMTATDIGKKAPEFEALTPEGKPLKLSQTLGKVTLIDFWASWCGPCRIENPNVVAAYKKYHDKGFNIISVSLDRPGAEAAWKNAIEKDGMTWFHVSRLQYWDDPIAKSYNVTGIPATFLVDENGIIIAKNLRGIELHNKLEEVLN